MKDKWLSFDNKLILDHRLSDFFKDNNGICLFSNTMFLGDNNIYTHNNCDYNFFETLFHKYGIDMNFSSFVGAYNELLEQFNNNFLHELIKYKERIDENDN